MKKNKISYPVICLVIFFSSLTFGQTNNFAIGSGVGFGSLMGDFPSQSTLGGKLFVEILHPLSPFNKFQIHYAFAQKVEKFLPGNNNIDYFSYMHSFGFSGLFVQPLTEQINIEEGLGIILMNDRSFDDINTWNYGIILNVAAGLPINKNIDIALNIDYGITFYNTNSSYVLFLVQVKHLL